MTVTVTLENVTPARQQLSRNLNHKLKLRRPSGPGLDPVPGPGRLPFKFRVSVRLRRRRAAQLTLTRRRPRAKPQNPRPGPWPQAESRSAGAHWHTTMLPTGWRPPHCDWSRLKAYAVTNRRRCQCRCPGVPSRRTLKPRHRGGIAAISTG